ncbi:MAG: hypothetical protein PHI98_11385 [Eubacteriales bacterium]|nr:hypothetical protein [Eubacteriales bacterium]
MKRLCEYLQLDNGVEAEQEKAVAKDTSRKPFGRLLAAFVGGVLVTQYARKESKSGNRL